MTSISHEAAEALNARLKYLDDRISVFEGRNETGAINAFLDQWKQERRAVELALVGEDDGAWQSIRWLQEQYAQSDMVLREEDGTPKVRLGGNEHWIFVDVMIGDDYGALDFTRDHAIWRNTGALYTVRYGEVADDPIYDPSGTFNQNQLDLEWRAR